MKKVGIVLMKYWKQILATKQGPKEVLSSRVLEKIETQDCFLLTKKDCVDEMDEKLIPNEIILNILVH